MKPSHLILAVTLVLGVVIGACAKREPEQPPPQQQPYYYPPPQQTAYPQQTAAPQPTYTAPPATATPTATAAPSGSASGTPTQIPGVTKNADGTCSLTIPGQQGGQPMV